MKGRSKSSKGFYIALAMSISMVGAACWFAYTQTSDDIEGQNTPSYDSELREEPVGRAVTDVTKAVPRERLTTMTAAASVTARRTEPSVTKPLEEKNDSEAPAQGPQAEEKSGTSLSMPIDGEVLNEFSGGELVKSKTTGAWQTHNGVDIKASSGDAVKAAGDGKVTAVENDALWGVVVTIDHGNGIVTRYCGLNSGVTVTAGQEVGRGEEIGAVGGTADIESSEESHLHFEVKKNGKYTDPKEMM